MRSHHDALIASWYSGGMRTVEGLLPREDITSLRSHSGASEDERSNVCCAGRHHFACEVITMLSSRAGIQDEYERFNVCCRGKTSLRMRSHSGASEARERLLAAAKVPTTPSSYSARPLNSAESPQPTRNGTNHVRLFPFPTPTPSPSLPLALALSLRRAARSDASLAAQLGGVATKQNSAYPRTREGAASPRQ